MERNTERGEKRYLEREKNVKIEKGKILLQASSSNTSQAWETGELNSKLVFLYLEQKITNRIGMLLLEGQIL